MPPAKRPASSTRERFCVEALEPRLLYSADLGPSLLASAMVSPVAEHRLLEAEAPPAELAVATQQTTQAREIVFVDDATPDAERLIADITGQGGRHIEVVRIAVTEDGLARISAELAARQDISAVHIISHGSDAAVQLGRGVLDADTLRKNAEQIARWGEFLTADADLLIYGCDVAATESGRALIDALARITGADVNASEDVTGSALLGGNWVLEYRTGSIESRVLESSWQGLLNAVPSGVETRVNATVAPTQMEAAVAMGGNGNYVIVWSSGNNQDGDGSGIYAQLYNAAGNTIGGEFRVNTYVTKDQVRPSAAMDSNGNFVIVWASDGQDGDKFGVYGQRYNAAGVAQGAEFRVSVSTVNQQDQPEVAMDASGNFVVAWQSDIGGNFSIYARRFDAAGTPLTGDFLVNTDIAKHQNLPTIAMNAGGAFVVGWKSTNPLDGSGTGVFGQLFNAAGSPMGGEFQINTVGSGNQDKPTAAMAPDGSFVIAWVGGNNQDGDKTGVFAQRFSAAGAKLGAEFRVNTTTVEAQDFPSIAIDASGNFTIAWQSKNQDGSGTGIYMQSYDATGFALGFETRVNSTTANDQLLPAIGMRPSGDFVVAWNGNGPGDTAGIFAQRYLYQNAAPVNAVPGAQETSGAAPLVFSSTTGNGISVADIDAALNPFQVTLSATNGTLTLSATAGLSFSVGDGVADGTMTFTGTLPAINAALEGMSFAATPFFSGAASLQIISNDLGNSGPGGALTDTDTVSINVAATGTPYMISGSYVGNGIDDRAITGLGFLPDVVILKARDDGRVAVIRTSSMAGDLSKEMTGGTALLANEIQSLDADGFTVGTNNTVNRSGFTYDWIAFKASPGWMTVGSYTGDGVVGRSVSGLGFSPEAVFLFDAGNQEAVFRIAGGANETYNFNNSGGDTTWISSLDSNGFSVGNNARVNALGRTYHYIAWNEIPGTMDVGTYTGNGLDNRNVTGVGFQPEWMLVKSEAGDATVQHFDSQGAGTDTSSRFTGNVAFSNRIQALQADGFQVGSDADVNSNGRLYSYLAFRQQTAPTISDIPDQTTNEDTPTAPIAFTVGDAETAPGNLIVRAWSSNQALVPDGNIVLGGSGANRTLTITPAAFQNQTVTITVEVSDGASSALDTFVLTVVAVNNAPAVSAPVAIAVIEDVASVLTGISFSDVDAGGAPVVATFAVAQGTLAAVAGGGVAVGGTPTNLTLTGALADLNTFIAAGSLSYTTAADDTNAVTLAVSVNDQGNTGIGGAKSSAVTNVTLNVSAVNDAPVNVVPVAQSVNEDVTLVFSSGNGNLIAVSDVDAGAGALQVTLAVTNGTLTLNGIAGLSFTTGDGTADANMVFTGTVAAINAALDGMGFTPTAEFSGAALLTLTTNDQGNSGAGGAKSDSDSVSITVNAVNDAPVNSVPGAQSVDEDNVLTFNTANANRISIADVDAGAGTLQVTLAVTNGTLALSGVGGLSFSTGDGTADATMVFTGSVANINAALDGLRFTPSADYNGAALLTITTDDQGNSGAGGALSDSDAISITVNPINDAPVNNVPGAQGTDQDVPLVLSTANGNAISISDPDVGTDPLMVTLTAVNGTLTLSGTGGLSFTIGDGTADAIMTFTGSLTDINAALDGLTFTPPNLFIGAGSIEIVTSDQGSSGAGGVMTDTDIVTVSINNVNDPPVNTVPGAQATNEDTPLVFSIAAGNRISIADPDAGANDLQVTLGVTNGTLTLNGIAGLSFTTGDGTADANMVFTGTLANINTALNGLTFTAAPNYHGAALLTITTDDQGNTGPGGPQSDTDIVNITVVAIADTPTVTNAATNEDTQSSSGLVITPNAADGPEVTHYRITSIVGGTLYLNNGVTLVSNGDFITVAAGSAGLRFTPAPDAIADGSFLVQASTAASTSGLGGGVVVATISITPVNDAPSLTLGGNFIVDEDAGPQSATGFAVALPGGGADEAGQTFSYAVNNDNNALFSVQPTIDVNGNLSYSPAANANGTATVTVSVTDSGGTANGGVDTSPPQVFTITVNPVNDAPVNVVPVAQSVDEDVTLVFSSGSGNLIAVSDVDAGAGALQVTLAVTNGTLTLNGIAGLSFTTGDGTADANMVFTGTVAAINAALDGMGFTPTAEFSGAALLTLTTNDQGNSGAGGAKSDSDSVSITVNAVNDAPVNSVPGAQSVDEDNVLTFNTANANRISIADVDAGAGTLQVTLAVTNGTLALSGVGGLSFSTGDGTADATMVFTGSVANINAALDGLRFTPSADYNGAALLTITTDDQGNSGAGGALSDSDAISITVNPGIDAPVNSVPGPQVVDEDTVLPIGGISVNDIDGNLSTVALAVSNGTLAVTLQGAAAISAGSNGSAGLTISGSQTDINATLATLQYQGALDFNGADTLTVTSTDTDGASDTSSIDITVTAINDAPVGVPTITGTVTEDQVLTADTSGISDGDGLGAFSYQWFRNGVAISSATASTYTLGDADVSTQISVQVSYVDAQGTNEGPLTSVQTVAVANVNDAPLGTASAVLVLQSSSYVFSVSNFGFGDPNDNPANALFAVRIASLPGTGTLTNNGVAVTAGQFVSAADINAGLLMYTPPAGANGAPFATFAFQVQDAGGTASGGVDLDPSARTMTINVAAAPAPVVPPIVSPPIAPDPIPPAPPPAIVPPTPKSGSEPAPAPATSRAPTGAEGLLLGSVIDAGGRLAANADTTQALDPGGAERQRDGAAPDNLLGALAPVQLAAEDERLDLNLFGLASGAGSSGGSSDSQSGTSLIQELDRMRDEIADQGRLEQWVAGSAAVGGFALSVGYVLWLLRGGALLASLLSSLPAWRLIDPLPVLSRVDEDENEDEGDDDDAFESFLESGSSTPPAEERA